MAEKKPIIETDRLILRRYCEEDLQDLYEYLSDETAVRFEPYRPMDMNEVKDALDRKITSGEMIAVELKSNHNNTAPAGHTSCGSCSMLAIFQVLRCKVTASSP